MRGGSAGKGRIQAAELFQQNVKPPEVARRLRVSLKSAYQWHHLSRDGGCEALALPWSERVAMPSVAALPGEARRVSQEPAAHGMAGGPGVDGARAATLIGRKFHVSYSISGATRLMHRLGFSPQVPVRRVAERDERAVPAWKEATWAEVKEPGRPAEATSASRTKPGSPGRRPKDEPGAGAGAPRS
ncbi:winged helix-turn-helix domain-containing protein [Streptomyces chartreusis]|uniref:winged helix-turn-helix domain-containing protein n=1 Tax=Streptomyces chartreusis TaxID=1969 RepID=UPI0037F334C4